jgi:hypothetical protein
MTTLKILKCNLVNQVIIDWQVSCLSGYSCQQVVPKYSSAHSQGLVTKRPSAQSLSDFKAAKRKKPIIFAVMRNNESRG